MGSVQEAAGVAYSDLDYPVLKVVLEAMPDATLAPNLRDWYARQEAREREALAIKHLPDVDLGPLAAGLHPYQRVGAQFLAQRGRAVLADEAGCVAGDTEVTVNRAGIGRRMTVEYVYQHENGLAGAWREDIVTNIRCFYDGAFRSMKLLGIYDKGVREVVQIFLEDGKSLRLTPDHEVLTSTGWRAAGDLTVWDKIITNGEIRCPLCGTTEDIITYPYAKFRGFCRTCMYRQLRKDKFKTGESVSSSDGYVYVTGHVLYHPYCPKTGAVLKHRLVVEASLNHLTYTEWLDIIARNAFTSAHVFLSPKVQVHHIDENRQNNDLSNLRVCNVPEHAVVHEVFRHIDIFQPKEVRVVGIEPVGVEHVYDLTVEGAHNFVANGIVVHNCGKTAQAILATALPTQAARVLVVCTNPTKLFWPQEIEKWNPGQHCVVIDGSKSASAAVDDIVEHGGYCIVNYDVIPSRVTKTGKVLSAGIADELMRVSWDWVILDECHRVNNRKTKVYKAISHLKFQRIAMLTGTPLGNNPAELWTLLHLTDPKKWTSYWKFFEAFVDYYDGDYGQEVKGAKNIPILRAHLAPVLLRRTLKGVGIQIPDPIVRELPLKLLPEQVKAYRELARELVTEIEGETLRVWSPGAKVIRLRQVVSTLACLGGKDVSAKLDALMELIEDEGKNEQWVVFSQFRATVDAVAARCKAKKIPVVEFKGGYTPAAVSQAIKTFDSGKAQVLVATMGAGGEGHNLQAARYLVRVEQWWNPNKNEQAMHRVVRLGQPRQVVVTDLHCPGTVDDLVKRILARKEGMTDAILREELLAHLREVV
jgi:hypothetical protein